MEIKIEYVNGNAFTVGVNEEQIKNIYACILDQTIPMWGPNDGDKDKH